MNFATVNFVSQGVPNLPVRVVPWQGFRKLLTLCFFCFVFFSHNFSQVSV